MDSEFLEHIMDKLIQRILLEFELGSPIVSFRAANHYTISPTQPKAKLRINSTHLFSLYDLPMEHPPLLNLILDLPKNH